MKSIKPGRGPSMMGGVGASFAVVFGIVWTMLAVNMGAPGFFPLFGVIFILLGVVQAIYHFKNATGKNRYSAFDITESGEEPDPLEERFGADREGNESEKKESTRFCPYCGKSVDNSFEFCPSCGKKLP